MDSRQLFSHRGIDKRRMLGLIIIGVIIAACLIVIIISLNIRYKPPAFEKGAKAGVPEVEESYLFKQVESDFGYRFYIAANLYRQADGSLNIYLTNPADNGVYLMCEIYDADTGEMYYKSGVLDTGSYIETLKPKKDFENAFHNIRIDVYAFEPETYVSAGTTELKLALQPW